MTETVSDNTPGTAGGRRFKPGRDGVLPAVPAWDQVLRLHSAKVYGLAYRLTGNRHDAEDLTQDVFLRVFRNLSTFRPGNFDAWLHRLTTNLFIDQFRHRQRNPCELLSDDAAARLPDREPTPDQRIDELTLGEEVEVALNALMPGFRSAVVLCDIEGLAYREIAVTLGIKVGTVSSRVHRGRAQLRSTLAHRAPALTSTASAATAESRGL